MPNVCYELYLDESGSFNDAESAPFAIQEASLVGGVLVVSGMLQPEYIAAQLPHAVHCCQRYQKFYLDVLEQLRADGARFVIFENKERLKVINGDTTYLNIISEGLVKLLRDLCNEHPDGVNINIIIATRKAMNASSGIIAMSKYREGLEEKLLMALGRNHLVNCTYHLSFRDARVYRPLDYADIICNTWYTKDRERKFNTADRARIETIYRDQLIYPVFEDAITAYIKQLLMERHCGEAMYQLCTLPKLTGFARLRNTLVKQILASDSYEQETWFSQMSLYLRQYNRLYLYDAGILLAENYKQYIWGTIVKADKVPRTADYWRFDTDFYLLTMYDHIGNTAKCQEHLQYCQENLECINRSWEHIDYYFRFCIRELNVLMGRFAFDEVLRKCDDLIEIFTEARNLFRMIKTYNNTQQPIRSELLGKVYGVQVEALINQMHLHPNLYEQALQASNQSIAEFSEPRDLSRAYQWRCLLMVQAKKPDEALACLLQAAEIPAGNDELAAFIDSVYAMRTGAYDFLLWHYTNVMLLMQEKKDPRGKHMAELLITHPKFIADTEDTTRKGHPWNLVLWNVSRYARAIKKMDVAERLYQRAMEITRLSKENVTMLTFAISMSADRLLWCREQKHKDLAKARVDFVNVCTEIMRAGMTEEMKNAFFIAQVGDGMSVGNKMLKKMAMAYLK